MDRYAEAPGELGAWSKIERAWRGASAKRSARADRCRRCHQEDSRQLWGGRIPAHHASPPPAERVKHYLVTHGIESSRVQVDSVGEEEASPAPKDWAKDRRVEIQLVP